MVALHFLDLLKSTRRSARDISIIYIFLKNLHTKKAARRTKGSGEIRSHVIDSLLLSTLRAAECGFYHGRNFTLPIILMKYSRSHFHFQHSNTLFNDSLVDWRRQCRSTCLVNSHRVRPISAKLDLNRWLDWR